MNELHVDADLSAYLDGELAPAARTAVDAHLGACDRCRSRLRELRATAALLAALPAPRPARSLVPRVAERFSWLRPVRALSAVATGAFLFAFLVTAVGRSGTGLGGGDASTAIFGGSAAAPAPAASAAALGTAAPALAPAPVPSVGFGAAAQPSPADKSASRSSGTAVPAPAAVEGAAPSPAAAFGPATTFAQKGPQNELADRAGRRSPAGPLIDPLFWLGLAVIAAVAAIAAHLRLRTR